VIAGVAAVVFAESVMPETAHAVPLTDEASRAPFVIWKKPALPPSDHWTLQRPAGAPVMEVPRDLRKRVKVAPAAPNVDPRGLATWRPLLVDPLGYGRLGPATETAPAPAPKSLGPREVSVSAPAYLDRQVVKPGSTGVFRDMPPRSYGVFGRGLDDADFVFGLLEKDRAARARRIAEENLARGEVDLDRRRPLSTQDSTLGVFVAPTRLGPRRTVEVCVYDRYWREYRCSTSSGR
jgi:hypothetical protein